MSGDGKILEKYIEEIPLDEPKDEEIIINNKDKKKTPDFLEGSDDYSVFDLDKQD